MSSLEMFLRFGTLLCHVALLAVTLLFTAQSWAHPGGVTAEGCHVCRTNCAKYGLQTGKKHCRNDPASSVAPTPAPAASTVAPAVSPAIATTDGLLRLDYEGFTVWLDCAKRGAVKFRYNAQRDTGSEKRASRFYLDPDVPKNCQQTSAKNYKTKPKQASYDRGHLVPANHLDASKIAIAQSNRMTNILPQVATMNRGAWLRTEEIIECYRDIDELLVIGGVLWGDRKADDFFVKSHGIKTPDAFWKVVIRGDGRVIAWIVPNNASATKKNLDRYLVSVREIEQETGEVIPVDDFRKDEVLATSWQIPLGCDRS